MEIRDRYRILEAIISKILSVLLGKPQFQYKTPQFSKTHDWNFRDEVYTVFSFS